MALPKPVRVVLGIAVLLYLAISITAGTTMLLVLFCLIRPFWETGFVRLACYIQGLYLNQIVWALEPVLGLQLRVTGEMPPREGALVLANHLTQDWVCMYSLAYRMDTIGFVRTVIKKVISYAPGFGWGMVVCYWPFVSRDFNKDEKVLRSLFGVYKSSELPVQVWLYPEGTRMTKRKLLESQEYAKGKGYPVWEHVMLPKHRGVNLAVKSLRGSVSMIHDVTLQYEGWGNRVPTFWDFLTCDPSKKHVMHVNVRRVPLASVPEGEEEQKTWLMDVFAGKEKLLAHFAANKCFPGKPIPTPATVSVGPLLPSLALFSTITYVVFFAAPRIISALL